MTLKQIMLIHSTLHRTAVWGFALVLAISQAAASPAQSDAKAQEYIQVRKIAMRDPKVRAAFDKARERLDRRIIEIDPSLKDYVERNKSGSNGSVPAESAASTTHIVAKGETLSSIARRFKTSVVRLKSANHSTAERQLKVGQQLVIPSATSAGAGHAGDHATWGKIKPDF